MLELVPEQVVELIQCQVGRDQALKAGEIVEMLTNRRTHPGLERQVRQIVKTYRAQGCPICADSGVGYWWPSSGEEVKTTRDTLRQRGLCSLFLAGKLHRQLPAFYGQLQFPWSRDWMDTQSVASSDPGLMVSCLVEVPETLYQIARAYLRDRPQFNQDTLVQAALSLYLLQEGHLEAAPFLKGFVDINFEA